MTKISSYRQRKKGKASRGSSLDGSSTNAVPFAALCSEEPEDWTDDQFMLNAEIDNIVANTLTREEGRVSAPARVEWSEIEAKIVKAVEDRPSLYRLAPNDVQASIESGYEELIAENAPSYSDASYASDKELATNEAENTTEPSSLNKSILERKTQKKVSQETAWKRIFSLRDRLVENHENLIRGFPVEQYSVSAGFIAMQAPHGRRYNLLAEAHNRQSQLSAHLIATTVVSARFKMIAKLRNLETSWMSEGAELRSSELESYVEGLDSCWQHASEEPGHRYVRRSQNANAPRSLFAQESSAVMPDDFIRDTQAGLPFIPNGLSGTDRNIENGEREEDETEFQEDKSDIEGTALMNSRAIAGLRARLVSNNQHLTSEGVRQPSSFTGRRIGASASQQHLETWHRLTFAIDRQIELGSHLNRLEDRRVRRQIVTFARSWPNGKWKAEVCDQYEQSLADSFQRLTRRSIFEDSSSASHQLSENEDLSEGENCNTADDGGATGAVEPEDCSRSSPVAQKNSFAAPIVDVQSSRHTSKDHQLPDSFFGHQGKIPAEGPSVVDRANPWTHLPSGQAMTGKGDSESFSTLASGETSHIRGRARAKRIIARLRLPEINTTAPGLLIWSQVLARDEFFQKVSKLFPGTSVQSVEVSLDGGRFLVESRDSEEEWEGLQDVLYQMLGDSPAEKLNIDAVVHVC